MPYPSERVRPLILIIDDDKLLRSSVIRFLRQSGFDALGAATGEVGLSLFTEHLPDLVMLDVLMPGLDGYAACRSLRMLPEGEFTPILFMTCLDDTDSIKLAFDAGATDFIIKPLNRKLLPYHLRYLLRSSEILQQLHATQARNTALLNAIPDAMIRLDTGGRILAHNRARLISPGSRASDRSGQLLTDLFPPDITERFLIALDIAVRSASTQVLDFQLPEGSDISEYEARIVADGRDTAVAIIRDVTEQNAFEKHRILAYYDTLTELPNRLLFREMLHRALKHADRVQRPAVLMFLDLDNFKTVNDTLGHAAGDRLLQEVAERLTTGIRGSDLVTRHPTDQSTSTVSRFGGDEFILLLTDLVVVDDAEVVARRIIEKLAQPVNLGDHEVVVSASIGVALYPQDATDSDLLLAYADRAMYAAKDLGKNTYQFYSPELVHRSSD